MLSVFTAIWDDAEPTLVAVNPDMVQAVVEFTWPQENGYWTRIEFANGDYYEVQEKFGEVIAELSKGGR